MSEYKTKPEFGTCDVCGKPATNFARDVIRTSEPGDVFATNKPADHIKRGCDEHPAESVVVTGWRTPLRTP